MPYIICIIGIAASIVVSSVFNSNQDSAVFCALLFIIFIIAIFKKVFITEDEVTKNFYQDVKEIIDERISQINIEKSNNIFLE